MATSQIQTTIFILVKNPPMLCFLIGGILAFVDNSNYSKFLAAGLILQVLWLFMFKKPIL